jgi:hypothetical protein
LLLSSGSAKNETNPCGFGSASPVENILVNKLEAKMDANLEVSKFYFVFLI